MTRLLAALTLTLALLGGTVSAYASDMTADDGGAAMPSYGHDGAAGGPWDTDGVYTAIETAASRHGVSRTLMIRVAYCESSLNPHAVNRWSGARGLYQLVTPGKLDAFYREGWTDWQSAGQQSEFFAGQALIRQLTAWVCR